MAKKRKKTASLDVASTPTKRNKTAAAIAEKKKKKKKTYFPDDILYHILSFFSSTKLQVRTSILSKRWRHLWMHSPTFLFPEEIDQYDISVDRCLQLCNAPTLRLVKLWIRRQDNTSAAAERWLNIAASRSTQELYLEFDRTNTDDGGNGNLQRPPPSLLRCQSLHVLSLKGCHLDHPGLSFPSLKSLTLTSASVAEATLNVLLSSSPLLQTLEFDWSKLLPESPSQGSEEAPLRINHPLLDKLSVCSVGCILEINLPNIRSFSYTGPPLPGQGDFHYHLNNLAPMPSLMSLELCNVTIAEATLKGLLQNSPLLQTLELSSIRLQPEANKKASKRRLLITHPRIDYLSLHGIRHKIEVNLPNIRIFRYDGRICLLSLAHAPRLHLVELFDDNLVRRSQSMSARNKMISAISEAKILYIDNLMYQIYQMKQKLHQLFLTNLGSKLHNLKELHYRVVKSDALKFVTLLSVITECPSLESLCIKCINGLTSEVGEKKAITKFGAAYQNTPSETLKRFELTMKNLKAIQLIGLTYSRYTMVFLDFLLQKAVALRALVIHPVIIDPVDNASRRRNWELEYWIRTVASQGIEVQIKDSECSSLHLHESF